MYRTPRQYTYRRHPPELRAKAVACRRQGYSLNELRDLLKVPKLTLQGWVKDIRLSAKARKRIRWRILEGGKIARARARVQYLNTTLQYTLQSLGEMFMDYVEERWWSRRESNSHPLHAMEVRSRYATAPQ